MVFLFTEMSSSAWFICSQFSLSIAALHEICLRLCTCVEQLHPQDAILSCCSDLIHTDWIRCKGKSWAKIRGLLTSMQKTQQPGEQRGKMGGDYQEAGREGENESDRQPGREGGHDKWENEKSHWLVAQGQSEIYSICLIKLSCALTTLWQAMFGYALGSQITEHLSTHLYICSHSLASTVPEPQLDHCFSGTCVTLKKSLKWLRDQVLCQKAKLHPLPVPQRWMNWPGEKKKGTQGLLWPRIALIWFFVDLSACSSCWSCWFCLSLAAGRWSISVWELGEHLSGSHPATTSLESWRRLPTTHSSSPTAPWVRKLV